MVKRFCQALDMLVEVQLSSSGWSWFPSVVPSNYYMLTNHSGIYDLYPRNDLKFYIVIITCRKLLFGLYG
jgi:hypothetical protein